MLRGFYESVKNLLPISNNVVLNIALEGCKSYICTDDIKTDLKQQKKKQLNQSTGSCIGPYNLSQKYLPK